MEQASAGGLRGGCRRGLDCVGVGEVVVGVDVPAGEHRSLRRGDAGSADGDLGGHGAVEVRVDDGQGELLAVAVGSDGGGAAEPGEGLDRRELADVAVASDLNGRVAQGVGDGGRGELGADGLGSAVGQVHLEDVEGGSDGELVFLREHQGVNAVDGLRDGGDGDLVGVALEDVEGDAGEEGVAHGGLLREVVLRGELGALAVPGSPLVDDELDLSAGCRALWRLSCVMAVQWSVMILSMRLPRVSRS